MAPCGVVRRPRRAAPLVASRVNGIRETNSSRRKVEAVALGDGVRVGGEHPLASGKGGDQHQERRAGQMKVGQQAVDGPEAMAWMNEQVGQAAASLWPTAGRAGGFERAPPWCPRRSPCPSRRAFARPRATSSGRARSARPPCGDLRSARCAPAKRTRPDEEGQSPEADAAALQLGEDRRREVQARGGCGPPRRTGRSEERLVARLVVGGGRASEVEGAAAARRASSQ